MSIISESLTIGLLLSLVFGALFFYIYSRLSYVEKRISLMENILLDIKITQEQMPTHILPEIPPNTRFQQVAFQPESHESHESHESEVISELKIEETNNKQEEIFVPEVDLLNEEYSAILEDVHRESPHHESPSDFTDLNPKVTVNYESMTKEELLEIAKQKGLRHGRAPGRDKLLQLIRKSEDLTNDLQPVESNEL